MDTKNRRDKELIPRVSLLQQRTALVILIAIGMGLLFYIYLFAIRQTNSRQVAWQLSFLIWILFEIFIVSTFLVLIQHVVIPSFVTREASAVKRKIAKDILAFKDKLDATGAKSYAVISKQSRDPQSPAKTLPLPRFNAAKYIYASWRLAQLHPEIPESAMVLRFSTPHPKQSMKRQAKSVSKSYSKKFTFIGNGVSRVSLYVIIGFFQIPPVLQDIIVQLCVTSGFGYVITLFARLYYTHPLLVTVPIALLILLAHFMYSTNKKSALMLRLQDIKAMEQATRNSTSRKVAPGPSDMRPASGELLIEKRGAGNIVTMGDGKSLFLTDNELVEFLRREYKDKKVHPDNAKSMILPTRPGSNMKCIQAALTNDLHGDRSGEAIVLEEEKTEECMTHSLALHATTDRRRLSDILEKGNPRPLSLEEILRRRGGAVTPAPPCQPKPISLEEMLRRRATLSSVVTPEPSLPQQPLSLEEMLRRRKSAVTPAPNPSHQSHDTPTQKRLSLQEASSTVDSVTSKDSALTCRPLMSLEEILKARRFAQDEATVQSNEQQRPLSLEEMLRRQASAEQQRPPSPVESAASANDTVVRKEHVGDGFSFLDVFSEIENGSPRRKVKHQQRKRRQRKGGGMRRLKKMRSRQLKARHGQQTPGKRDKVLQPLYDADDEVDCDISSSDSEGIAVTYDHRLHDMHPLHAPLDTMGTWAAVEIHSDDQFRQRSCGGSSPGSGDVEEMEDWDDGSCVHQLDDGIGYDHGSLCDNESGMDILVNVATRPISALTRFSHSAESNRSNVYVDEVEELVRYDSSEIPLGITTPRGKYLHSAGSDGSNIFVQEVDQLVRYGSRDRSALDMQVVGDDHVRVEPLDDTVKELDDFVRYDSAESSHFFDTLASENHEQEPEHQHDWNDGTEVPESNDVLTGDDEVGASRFARIQEVAKEDAVLFLRIDAVDKDCGHGSDGSAGSSGASVSLPVHVSATDEVILSDMQAVSLPLSIPTVETGAENSSEVKVWKEKCEDLRNSAKSAVEKSTRAIEDLQRKVEVMEQKYLREVTRRVLKEKSSDFVQNVMREIAPERILDALTSATLRKKSEKVMVASLLSSVDILSTSKAEGGSDNAAKQSSVHDPTRRFRGDTALSEHCAAHAVEGMVAMFSMEAKGLATAFVESVILNQLPRYASNIVEAKKEIWNLTSNQFVDTAVRKAVGRVSGAAVVPFTTPDRLGTGNGAVGSVNTAELRKQYQDQLLFLQQEYKDSQRIIRELQQKHIMLERTVVSTPSSRVKKRKDVMAPTQEMPSELSLEAPVCATSIDATLHSVNRTELADISIDDARSVLLHAAEKGGEGPVEPRDAKTTLIKEKDESIVVSNLVSDVEYQDGLDTDEGDEFLERLMQYYQSAKVDYIVLEDMRGDGGDMVDIVHHGADRYGKESLESVQAIHSYFFNDAIMDSHSESGTLTLGVDDNDQVSSTIVSDSDDNTTLCTHSRALAESFNDSLFEGSLHSLVDLDMLESEIKTISKEHRAFRRTWGAPRM